MKFGEIKYLSILFLVLFVEFIPSYLIANLVFFSTNLPIFLEYQTKMNVPFKKKKIYSLKDEVLQHGINQHSNIFRKHNAFV